MVLKGMATELKWNRKSTLRYFPIFGAINSIIFPIVSFLFGDSYFGGVRQYAIFYAIAFLVIVALWCVGIRVMKLDAKGPISWYASPLVWFTPIFCVVMYMMFSLWLALAVFPCSLLAFYNRYIPPSSRILGRQKLPAHGEFLIKSLSRQVHGIATVAAVYGVHACHQAPVVGRRVK